MTTVSGANIDQIPELIDTVVAHRADVYAFARYCPTSGEKDVGVEPLRYQFSDEDLRRRRAESVQNVKKTNGRVSLEQRVRGAWEEGDEWQD